MLSKKVFQKKLQDIIALDTDTKRLQEAEENFVTREELLEHCKTLGIDMSIAEKALEVELPPFFLEVRNITCLVSDVYALSYQREEAPSSIINQLSLDQEMKDILHEAVEAQKDYLHAMELGRNESHVNGIAGFCGGITTCTAGIVITYLGFSVGIGFIPLFLAATAGGLASGAAAAKMMQWGEGWTEKQKQLTMLGETHKLYAAKRDEKLNQLQQRLDRHYYPKK